MDVAHVPYRQFNNQELTIYKVGKKQQRGHVQKRKKGRKSNDKKHF